MISLDSSDYICLGDSSSHYVASTFDFIPRADSSYNLGGSGKRWVNIYATNATINTSDPSLKTDINPLPPVEALIKSINPITFRWKQDSATFIDATEEKIVHATEWQEIEEDVTVVRDGKAIRTRQKRMVEVHLYDEVPLEDENGDPVMTPVRAQRDIPGKVTHPASTRQLTYRAPRMVTKQVTVKRPVSGLGKELHWGFSAPEIKAAFDAIGMDFGGHVVGEDGMQHLRPAELIPVLWKAVQGLLERVEALESGRP